MDLLSKAVLSGTEEAASTVITMAGMMALWGGFMKIAEQGGIVAFLSKLLSPALKFLFPEYLPDSLASKMICMNITANFLGLGNAATPFGIMAIKEMNKTNPTQDTASNSIAMFVILNTASVQLVPTFLCALRQKHGSCEPFSILPSLSLTSFIALSTGILSAKCLGKIWVFRPKKEYTQGNQLACHSVLSCDKTQTITSPFT